MPDTNEPSTPPIPDALRSNNPLRWFRFIGPGAIIASLTIGTGELVFSTRGGAIFGYRIAWLFLFISVLKWGLVYATSRHMVLSGAHPFERWRHLPGPRGWFPLFLLVLLAPCFPIWVGFLSGVLGTLGHWQFGADPHLCGAVAVAGLLVIALTGGYHRLEVTQLLIVGAMLLASTLALVLLKPDWWAMLYGLLVPQPLTYPVWLTETAREIADRPVWVETCVYVSVIGGASSDYLAYISFLRDKGWGLAGHRPADADAMNQVAADPHHPARRWVRAVLIDSVTSFAAVILFSVVFVSLGAKVLHPQHIVPTDLDMLNHQAEFLTTLHPLLLPLYIGGASLTLLGTVYGVFEIVPRLLQETFRAVDPDGLGQREKELRRVAILWSGLGGLAVIAWNYGNQNVDLIGFITPVSLFTGVFSCGLVCLLAPWADWRFLPPPLRMNRPLVGLTVFAGIIFIVLGIKSYWDYGWQHGSTITVAALGGLVAALLTAWLLAIHYARR